MLSRSKLTPFKEESSAEADVFLPRDLKRAQMGKSEERKETSPVQKKAN